MFEESAAWKKRFKVEGWGGSFDAMSVPFIVSQVFIKVKT